MFSCQPSLEKTALQPCLLSLQKLIHSQTRGSVCQPLPVRSISGPKHWLPVKKPVSLRSFPKSLVRPGPLGSPSSLWSVEVAGLGVGLGCRVPCQLRRPWTYVSVWTESLLGYLWTCGLVGFHSCGMLGDFIIPRLSS